MREPAAVLSGLFVYPLKSAAGIALERAEVGERGLVDDRRWMVVGTDLRFVSQRTHPRLALVRTAFAADGLRVAAPGLPEITLPRPPAGAPGVTAEVHHDRVAAVPVGGDAAAWMSEHLGCRCEVVYLPDDAEREVEPGFGPAQRISFADAFPFLLLSEASLADLNRRLAAPVTMDRFRPNLVVAGCSPYEEDDWLRVRVADVPFTVAKPCVRCSITTVDQETGERGPEPLATLATYRRAGKGVVLGQNLIHEGRGALALGDALRPLAARTA